VEKKPNHRLSPMRCPVALDDVDLFGPGAQEHWYEAYEILHAQAPVQVLRGQGFSPDSDAFVLTRHEDIARVVRDPERYKPTLSLAIEGAKSQPEDGAAERAPQNAMIRSMATLRPDMDLWRAHRQELTDPWVGPGATRHEAMITGFVDDLIDSWIDDARVEFVSAFARPLPQRVMATVLGFPLSDLPQLEEWGNAQVAPFVYGRGHLGTLSRDEIGEQTRVLAGFSEYVQRIVREKRRDPGDDMISSLTQIEYKALGRKLSDEEIDGIVYAMVIGGLETTQYAIAEQAQLLCEDPALFAELRADPRKIRPFTEEAMRLRAPTQGLSTRITTRDEVFGGVEVPKGSPLHLRFAAANVDPDHYECPHQIQLDRKRIGGHLTFSQGPRICPGANLSRLEQQIAWTRLSTRLGSLEYAEGNRFLHQPGIMLGTLELQLRFTRA